MSGIGGDGGRKVVVVGGGPAGLTAAYQLMKAGVNPIVLEQEDKVGGLARTENYKGFYFDMGGHRFFTKVKEVNEMWHEVLSHAFIRRPRLSRIYYKGKFFHYPLKPLNALFGLGPIESVFIGLSYLRWQLFPYRKEETFEQWVTNRFGKRLFLTFFKAYTEKVWGIPCSELKAEWAAQRIKDLSLSSLLLNMFMKGGNTIKTLIESFEYPRRGPGMMWNAVKDQVEEAGGSVELNSPVVEIRRTGMRIDSVVVSANGTNRSVAGTDFISSMPLTALVKRMVPAPPQEVLAAADRLFYRDFLTVCLIVNKDDLFPDNWIYIHDPEVVVGRIQNFKNWSPDMVADLSKTSVGMEYFCNEGDSLWTMEDADLVELGKKELSKLGLAAYEDIEDGAVFRVPKSYPVYSSDYGDYLATLRQWVDGLENLVTIGRNGLHRYNNQDHAMLTGMYAVRNLLHGETNDLWSVNTDQEYHEEVREAGEPVEVEEAMREAFSKAFAKLDRTALGTALGVVGGLGLFAATLWLLLKGGEPVGPHLDLLRQFLPGYRVSLAGGVLGMLYGFGLGFIAGWSIAFLRNTAVFMTTAIIHRRAERQLLRRLLEYL